MQNVITTGTIYRMRGRSEQMSLLHKDGSFWLTIRQVAKLFKSRKGDVRKVLKPLFRKKAFNTLHKRRFFYSFLNGPPGMMYCKQKVVVHIRYALEAPEGERFRLWCIRKSQPVNDGIRSFRSGHPCFAFYDRIKPHKRSKKSSFKALTLRKNSNHLSPLLEEDFNQITYYEAILAIRKIKRKYGGSNWFAKEKGNAFKSALHIIYQTYDGKALYPGVHTKAAHLLYFVLKNQSFYDGNKRIALFMFIWFLHRNKIIFRQKGPEQFRASDLIKLSEYVAHSERSQKDQVIMNIVNFLKNPNQVFATYNDHSAK